MTLCIVLNNASYNYVQLAMNSISESENYQDSILYLKKI